MKHPDPLTNSRPCRTKPAPVVLAILRVGAIYRQAWQLHTHLYTHTHIHINIQICGSLLGADKMNQPMTKGAVIATSGYRPLHLNWINVIHLYTRLILCLSLNYLNNSSGFQLCSDSWMKRCKYACPCSTNNQTDNWINNLVGACYIS